MSSRKFVKGSESSKIIVLANFTKNKICPVTNKGIKLDNQLSKMIWKSTGVNQYVSKEFKLSKRRIKSLINKKMKKGFKSHIDYLANSIGEIHSVGASAPLKVACAKISDSLKLMSLNK